MNTVPDIPRIQADLRARGFGGWLLCDFHNRDHLAYRVLGLDVAKMTSRRWFYYIPARGEPKRLVHTVEKGKLDSLPGSKTVFLSWESLHASLKKILGPPKKVAMQYSPKNNIPYVSMVDAGVVELVKSFGHKVVSSADLVQTFEALIDANGYRLHREAGVLVDRIRAEAFDRIRASVRNSDGLTEYDLQQFIVRRFKESGLVTIDPPIVGTNEHPADPHFESTPANARPFKKGDTVLIDLWAKKEAAGDRRVMRRFGLFRMHSPERQSVTAGRWMMHAGLSSRSAATRNISFTGPATRLAKRCTETA